MALEVKKVEVWAGDVPDQAGGMASVLSALAAAGADLECLVGRRQADKPGTGVLFVTPIQGKKVQAAARQAGLTPANGVATLRVAGPDKPGVGSRIAEAVADAGISVRGISSVVIGNKFVCYVSFDNAGDADVAGKAIKKANGSAKRK